MLAIDSSFVFRFKYSIRANISPVCFSESKGKNLPLLQVWHYFPMAWEAEATVDLIIKSVFHL